MNATKQAIIHALNFTLSHMITDRKELTEANVAKSSGIPGIIMQVYETRGETFSIIHPCHSSVHIKVMTYHKDGLLYPYRVEGDGFGKIYNYGIAESSAYYL